MIIHIIRPFVAMSEDLDFDLAYNFHYTVTTYAIILMVCIVFILSIYN